MLAKKASTELEATGVKFAKGGKISRQSKRNSKLKQLELVLLYFFCSECLQDRDRVIFGLKQVEAEEQESLWARIDKNHKHALRQKKSKGQCRLFFYTHELTRYSGWAEALLVWANPTQCFIFSSSRLAFMDLNLSYATTLASVKRSN